MIFRMVLKFRNIFFSVLSQFTRLTDRQTDRQTAFSSLHCVCIPCSAVKIGPVLPYPIRCKIRVNYEVSYYYWHRPQEVAHGLSIGTEMVTLNNLALFPPFGTLGQLRLRQSS